MKTLETFDDVLQKLGGPAGVAALTKRSVQSVANWQARGNFPAVLVEVIRDELRTEHRCDADLDLFRVEKPRRRR